MIPDQGRLRRCVLPLRHIPYILLFGAIWAEWEGSQRVEADGGETINSRRYHLIFPFDGFHGDPMQNIVGEMSEGDQEQQYGNIGCRCLVREYRHFVECLNGSEIPILDVSLT